MIIPNKYNFYFQNFDSQMKKNLKHQHFYQKFVFYSQFSNFFSVMLRRLNFVSDSENFKPNASNFVFPDFYCVTFCLTFQQGSLTLCRLIDILKVKRQFEFKTEALIWNFKGNSYYCLHLQLTHFCKNCSILAASSAINFRKFLPDQNVKVNLP